MATDDYKKKYEDALKRIEALEKQLKNKNTEKQYEERHSIDELLQRRFGERPVMGGPRTRWELSRELVKALYREQEGNYPEFLRRFSGRKGLTVPTLEANYMRPLIEDEIIELFEGRTGMMWRWKVKIKKEP